MTTSDLVTFGETMLRFSPPRGELLETSSEFTVQAGGAESNVAVAAARLGANTTWLSKLPKSPLGKRVESSIRQHGVTPAVAWDASTETRQGTYYLEHGAEPRPTTVLYDRRDAAITTVTPSELDTAAIESASLFFTTGITPALSATTAETTHELLEIASAADTRTAFDLNYRAKLWEPADARETYESLFELLDLLFIPERDAHHVLGMSGSASEIAATLSETYNIETVVITRGEDGALALRDDSTVTQPIFETETVDPIGTGDAFVGGFLAEELTGSPLEQSLAVGSAAAALKRTLHGDVAVISRAEVANVLSDSGYRIDR